MRIARRLNRRLLAPSSPTRFLSSSSSSEELVTVETVADGVAKVTLNDPARLNALSVDMGKHFRERIEELREAAASGDVRAVVLTGAGKAFSAGGDIKWLLERSEATPAANEQTMLAFYDRFLSIRSLPVPTVAALNGPAIGAGLGVALACDCRVAAADAKLGLTFVGLGLHPGMGSTHFLPRIAGPAAAAKLLLSGRIVSGTEALAAASSSSSSSSSSSTGSTIANISPDASSMAIVGGYGFVEEVTPSGAAAVDAAIATAKGFAAAAPVAVSTCLATLRAQGDDGLHASLQREAAAQAVCYASADYRAGVLAIMEKRKPVFTGA